ncbi:small ribosomal subunit Rsm22 family protein [Wenjunlia tyrosinilytica]|jgi:ribosomal protein RSM22 (predicted rRNA methylase)|uniref:rRNA methyltransferase n=1 Tax=Wenjunlia tyrosinilytica TaxID=1544741 RepID=A0A917ZSN6_9ACTN|nr:small ribosomal subunit Rsm22 family protein [Wenjunlia tyrosinilytica]GGO89101.1 rRNA methyltransferase [Wenjunlia tyrosinilytica]
MELPEELGLAFSRVLAGLPAGQVARAVDRLMDNYRGTMATDKPLLASRADVAAYAAYRMPATYAAVRFALGEFARLAPEWAPRTHVDVGGGTGAAAWAAADTWPRVASTTVLDWSDAALDLGRELASSSPALKSAQWRKESIGAGLDLPDADLLTVSYVLGELTDEDRATVVSQLIDHGGVVAVVEPGTPAGYARIREVRDRLIAAGMSVVAPCPHNGRCPIVPGEDWCHFAVRLSRSSLHRQVKGGSLSYEDEKVSYVIASRVPLPRAENRVMRHPGRRKGMVSLQLCTREEALGQAVVTKKRHGPLYRRARDTSWGDAWPPVDSGDGRSREGGIGGRGIGDGGMGDRGTGDGGMGGGGDVEQ